MNGWKSEYVLNKAYFSDEREWLWLVQAPPFAGVVFRSKAEAEAYKEARDLESYAAWERFQENSE